MPIIKLRDLGTAGVVTDQDPYALPAGTWSNGVNVRFRNNKITPAPVYRTVKAPLAEDHPRYSFTAGIGESNNDLFIGYQSGNVYYYSNGTETLYSPPGYAASNVETNWTSYTIGNVVYVNRADRPPWYYLPTASNFEDLSAATYATTADAWDPTWTAKIIAQCGGAIVALNMTKGAASFPTMVKTSSPVQADHIPASWDITNPATLATENILQSMDGPIMDACSLGQDLIIYGQREAWRMHADGSTFVYSYTKLSYAKGVLNTNCSIELDGKNYCFGIDDIWVHDGISEQSLCDQQVRDFIYGSLNISEAGRCWVQYNPRLNELYFGYVSGDPLTNFKNVEGCNRAAVYNMTSQTWSFDDLPSIFNTDNGPVSNILTYDTVTDTYDTMGGSYQDQEDGGKRITIAVGGGSAEYGLTPSLYAIDQYGPGSVAPYPVDANATAPVQFERVGIDLDELDASLRDYKLISTVYPQARVDTDGGHMLQIAVGASDFPNDLAPTWGPYQPYDGVTKRKLDVNVAGRWLAIRVLWDDWHSFTMTGLDLDIKTTGRRG
jgi:hypothetical protein